MVIAVFIASYACQAQWLAPLAISYLRLRVWRGHLAAVVQSRVKRQGRPNE